MAELYLIRHGQASFGAANYDKLSELGHQQAKWLGEYYKHQGLDFGHIVTGDLVRQRETAAGICEGLGLPQQDFDTHLGLNEFNFDAIIKAYLAQFPEQTPGADVPRSAYYQLLRKAMICWSRNELQGELPETWQGFEDRVRAAIEHIRGLADKKRVMAVSSGGAMAMAMKIILRTEADTVIELNLQTRNTGVSHFFYNERSIRLTAYNHTPHLDDPSRHPSVSYS